MSLSDQYSLDLTADLTRMGRAEFFVTDANRHDLKTLDAWARSEEFALIICGAPSAGKTHLATILLRQLDGEMITVAQDGGLDRVADGALFIIDGLEQLGRPKLLLEAIERARLSGDRLVMVGRGDPKDWAGGLRDLETRLGAIARLTVSPPDEALLRNVMAKRLTDMQQPENEKLIEYAVRRLPRSLEAVTRFLGQLHDLAVERRKRMTIALARELIDQEEL